MIPRGSAVGTTNKEEIGKSTNETIQILTIGSTDSYTEYTNSFIKYISNLKKF